MAFQATKQDHRIKLVRFKHKDVKNATWIKKKFNIKTEDPRKCDVHSRMI